MTHPANPKTPPSRQVTAGPVASARILDAAEELFYREGSRSVGVDAVVKEAGVNKMSLYRQFSSKDELLRQYAQRSDAKFWRYFDASVAQHPDDPAAALVQFFVDLAGRAAKPDYRGCPLLNLSVEYPDRDHFSRVIVADNKRLLLQRLTELATAAGASAPVDLAKGLALLIEGAYAGSQTYATESGLMAALPAAARALVTLATGRPVAV